MRVSSVGVHEGAKAHQGHYHLVNIERKPDGGYQWATYDDVRVYPGLMVTRAR